MGFFKRFESQLPAYPDADPSLPPKGFMAFLWACTEGARGYVLLLALLSAVLAVFEALLFAMLGRVVDWLGATAPARLWAEHGTALGKV